MQKPASPLIPLGWLALVVLLDQWSKALVMEHFTLYELRPVIPGLFNLTHLTNTGAAFGMLAGAQTTWRQLFFVGVAVVALGVMIFSFKHFRSQSRLYIHALGLIAGGAVGNLIDRVRFGAVVDFLDFYVGSHHWPAFNVADSAITVGVGLFLLASWLAPEENAI
ncbi:MAG: signal peptidase II [Thermodesulfobacteriota bacterium]